MIAGWIKLMRKENAGIYLDVMLNVVDVTIMLTSSKNFLGLLVLDDVVSDSYEIKKKLSEKIYDEGG